LSCEVLGFSPLTLTRGGGGGGKETETFDLPDPPHIQQPLIQTIVDELLARGGGGGMKCPSTGTSAARTSAVMDAALHSFYNGRDDEFWNRPQTWRRAT
jgi:hypothetical protein